MRRAGWVVLALALGPTTAWAAEDAPTEPLTLRYEAPAACGDGTAFFAQLRARTAHIRTPSDGESARVVVVRIKPNGTGFFGHLHFEDNGVTTSPRVVESKSCAEVVEALNLSAALAVDPSASTAPAAALPAEAPSTDAGVPVATPAPPVATPAAPGEAPPAPRQRATRTGRADEERSPEPSTTRFGAGVGVEAAALSSFVPSGRVFVEVVFNDGGALWSPAVRVAGMRSLAVDQAPSEGQASLTWTAGGLDLCPLRVPLVATLSLRPCAGAVAGVVSSDAAGLEVVQNRTRPWVTVDLHGRLAWEPVRVLSLELEAGALAPLVREELFFRPSTEVYQAPVLGFFGRAGVAVRFP